MTTANRRLLMAASRPIDVLRKFTFDRTGGNANINTCTARIKRLRGNTIVWNQLVQNGNFADGITGWELVGSTYGVVSVANGVTTMTIIDNPPNHYTPSLRRMDLPMTIFNHKVYLRADVYGTKTSVWRFEYGGGGNGVQFNNISGGAWVTISSIMQRSTAQTSGNITIYPYYTSASWSANDTWSIRNIKLIDLTLMFGAGNEPTSVEEFESMFPLDYYDYNAGQLLSFTGDEIKTTGFNQWDEQWELGGLNGSNGQKIRDDSRIRTKNYIPVLPSTQYYIKFPQFTPNNIGTICYYDANKNFIYATYPVNSSPFANTPAGAWYMLITFYPAYGTTYNYDICVNISHNGTKNGTYEEYEQHTKDISFYKSIKDGQGNTLFPYGLLSAGSVYDEVTATKAIKRIGAVDLGTLSWGMPSTDNRIFSATPNNMYSPSNANGRISGIVSSKCPVDTQAYLTQNMTDKTMLRNAGSIYIRDTSYTTVADFKTAMNGVMLYYELAEPIEVPLDNINLEYPAYRTGTEELLPANGAVPITTPALFDIRYKIGGRRN